MFIGQYDSDRCPPAKMLRDTTRASCKEQHGDRHMEEVPEYGALSTTRGEEGITTTQGCRQQPFITPCLNILVSIW